jgi:50S ribosomal protein L16 3-hydroxylase
MLDEWLGDVTLEAFRTRHLGRLPFARPGTALPVVHRFDWKVLAEVLAADAALDTIVCSRGNRLPLPPPQSLRDLDAMFGAGIGLCIRGAERSDPGLAEIHAAFEEVLGSAQVQLFVTPPGTHGFSWHYDDEEVFIVQTLGTKEYLFRANSVCADRRAHGREFARFADETTPISATTLVPGDFLYLPARWWHMAECSSAGPSLSISVGVRTRRE